MFFKKKKKSEIKEELFVSNIEELLVDNSYLIINQISPQRKSLVGGVMKNGIFKNKQSVYVYNKDGLHSTPSIFMIEIDKEFVDEAVEDKAILLMFAQEDFKDVQLNYIILENEIDMDTLQNLYK